MMIYSSGKGHNNNQVQIFTLNDDKTMDKFQLNDSIVIYKDNNPSGARTIWIKLIDDKLYMEEQDYSPQLEDIFGRDTYERFISKVSKDEIKYILQVDTNEQLIQILKQMFGKNSGVNDFCAFVDSNNISYQFDSY